jgi:hypothetical protein
VVVAAGHYLTSVQQPAKLQKIEDTIKLASLQKVEVSQLLVEQSASQELASQSLAKWKTRYKEIPTDLNTADMILYLEDLTATGFERFDIDLAGNTAGADFSYYTFKVNATAYFSSMYHFVWHIENNREFYRIRDLKVGYKAVYKENVATDRPRRHDMVDFSFELDAYYAGNVGMSAAGDSLLPVPRNLLPTHDPSHNSFFPIVRTDLPPNDEMLLDVEASELISIVGRRAIFDSGGFQYVVEEGDRIYLGSVLAIDPNTAKVRVQLDKGGNVMRFDIDLQVEQLQNARQPGVVVQPLDR